MLTPYTSSFSVIVFDIKIVVANLFLSPTFLIAFIIYLFFAIVTYTLTQQKWYDKLIFVLCFNHTYFIMYVYILKPYYVGFIIIIPFFFILIYGVCYSFNRYGFSLNSCSVVWKDLLTDYQSYKDNLAKPSITSILIKRTTLSSILTDKTLTILQKVIKVILLVYYSNILIFLITLNAYFGIRRVIKLALFIMFVSKPFTLYLYDLSTMVPVTVWDCIIVKMLGYFSISGLFLALLSQCLLVLLILCFDKHGWVKEFEAFYGSKVLATLGYNNPYKSFVNKTVALGIGAEVCEFLASLSSCAPSPTDLRPPTDPHPNSAPNSQFPGEDSGFGVRPGSAPSGSADLHGEIGGRVSGNIGPVQVEANGRFGGSWSSTTSAQPSHDLISDARDPVTRSTQSPLVQAFIDCQKDVEHRANQAKSADEAHFIRKISNCKVYSEAFKLFNLPEKK